jgi:hypothetical protein
MDGAQARTDGMHPPRQLQERIGVVYSMSQCVPSSKKMLTVLRRPTNDQSNTSRRINLATDRLVEAANNHGGVWGPKDASSTLFSNPGFDGVIRNECLFHI